jgi:hypothetical protein
MGCKYRHLLSYTQFIRTPASRAHRELKRETSPDAGFASASRAEARETSPDARERAVRRASWIALNRPWHDQITIV